MPVSGNRRMLRDCVLFAVVCGMSGCGGSDVALAPVRGRVTLDGHPVANAWVKFHPSKKGRGSEARTNHDGVFELEYTAERRGALLGEHKVEVGTREGNDALGNPINRPELIPARYNTESTLQASVVSGENVVDLELTLEAGETLTPRLPIEKQRTAAR